MYFIVFINKCHRALSKNPMADDDLTKLTRHTALDSTNRLPCTRIFLDKWVRLWGTFLPNTLTRIGNAGQYQFLGKRRIRRSLIVPMQHYPS